MTSYADLGLHKTALRYDELKRRERVILDYGCSVPFEFRLEIQTYERLLERAVMRSMHEDA